MCSFYGGVEGIPCRAEAPDTIPDVGPDRAIVQASSNFVPDGDERADGFSSSSTDRSILRP
jgi:hypothetical protein